MCSISTSYPKSTQHLPVSLLRKWRKSLVRLFCNVLLSDTAKDNPMGKPSYCAKTRWHQTMLGHDSKQGDHQRMPFYSSCGCGLWMAQLYGASQTRCGWPPASAEPRDTWEHNICSTQRSTASQDKKASHQLLGPLPSNHSILVVDYYSRLRYTGIYYHRTSERQSWIHIQ